MPAERGRGEAGAALAAGPGRAMVISHQASRTGAPLVALRLIEALVADGWTTTVVHRWGGPLEFAMARAADESRAEPFRRLQAALNRRTDTKPTGWKLERRSIARVVAAVRPDVIWCNTTLTAGYLRPARDLHIPLVLFSHEETSYAAGAINRAGPMSEYEPGLPGVTLLGCSTPAAADLAEALGGGREVGVLHSPVDVTEARRRAVTPPPGGGRRPERDGRALVIGAGRAVPRKGVDTFVAAARRARAAGSTARWVWVGRDDELDPALRADGVVEFVGEQPSAVPWIAAADVFVLSSVADPFPLVVLEAMAVGCPVVTTDLAGTREQLGDAAVFVPVGDAAATAAAVEALLADPDRRAALAAAAGERVVERWDVGPFRRRVAEITRRAAATG